MFREFLFSLPSIRYSLPPLSSPESTDRRGFLRSCLQKGLIIGELAGIGGGAYILGRHAYYAILTRGVTDRRFTPEATLPQEEQATIPFQELRDGETLLGKRIALPRTGREDIPVELGFVSVATGRELRLRLPPPGPLRIFRATEQWDGVLATQHILDVLRENREHIRICSQYGAALLATVRCGDIAHQLKESQQRFPVISDVPFELRSPLITSDTRDISFERIDD